MATGIAVTPATTSLLRTPKYPISSIFRAMTTISGGAVAGAYFWKDNGETFLGHSGAGINGVITDFEYHESLFVDADTVAFCCYRPNKDNFTLLTYANIDLDNLNQILDTVINIPDADTVVSKKFSNFKRELDTLDVSWIEGLYYRSKATGALTASSTCRSSELIPKPIYFNIETSINGNAQCALQFWDSDKKFLGFLQSGTNGVETPFSINETDVDSEIWRDCAFISVCCSDKKLNNFTALGSYSEDIKYTAPLYEVPNIKDNFWKGKTIYFCGTSIPGGGYPQIVCELLGANCVNKAIGSSVLRKALRDGGGFTQIAPSITDLNYVRAFSATKAEKEALFGSSEYNQYSYEELLLPYLDGTNPLPDLFVIDFASDEKVRSGKQDPYFTEINTSENKGLPADYPLQEDTLTSAKGIEFNRNTYTGAALFIINLIYQYNPQAKILMIGFQNEQLRPNMIKAQNTVRNYYQIPYFNLSEKLGWSSRILTGSKDKFNKKYSPTYSTISDVSAMKFWCPDDTHPHSNPVINSLGFKESNFEIARLISEFIKII